MTRGPARTPGRGREARRRFRGGGCALLFTPANQACPFPCSQSRATPAFHPARLPTRRGSPSPPPHPASGEVGDAAGPAPGPARRLRADVMLRAGRCGGSCKSTGPELVRKEPAGRATLTLCPTCPWRTPPSAWWTFFFTILFWVLWGIIPRVSPLCAAAGVFVLHRRYFCCRRTRSGFYKWLPFARALGEKKPNECLWPAGRLIRWNPAVLIHN